MIVNFIFTALIVVGAGGSNLTLQAQAAQPAESRRTTLAEAERRPAEVAARTAQAGEGPAEAEAAQSQQVELIAPDNNDVTITLEEARQRGLTAFPRLSIGYLKACEGAKDPKAEQDLLKVAERQMELKSFIRNLAALPPERRRLSQLQEETLAEMPLCDEYLLELVTLSRLLDGYQLRE